MAPRLLLMVFLGLLSATCVFGSTTLKSNAVGQGKPAQSVYTIGPPSISKHPSSPPLLLSKSRNTQATLNPATTTTIVGSRQGKSLLSSRGSRNIKEPKAGEPEVLPTPEALTFPVPAFLANLFSGGAQQRAKTLAGPARRQFRQNPREREFLPQQPFYDRRPQRESAAPRAAHERDSENYYFGSDRVRDSSTDGRSQYTDINGNYDFISDTSYAPRAVQASKNSVQDSDVFDQRNNYENGENSHGGPPESFGKIEGKDFGSAENYKENEVANFKPSQGDYRNEEYNNPLESYYDDLKTETDYDFRDYKSDSLQREQQFSNHRYQSEESPLFGGFFSALNPMNYFRAPVKEPPPPTRFAPRTRPGRRAGAPSRFGPHQNDENTESLSVTDYFDFSALEPYESREFSRWRQPEFSQKFRNSDHHPQRINKQRGQRLFREEIPVTGERYRENFPNSKRNGRPLQRNTGRRPSMDDIPPIVDDLVSFTKDVGRPLPPPRYDPRRTREGSPVNRGYTERNHDPILNRSNEFTLNVPSDEIKYEDIPALKHDPRLEPFKYKEDFPLRDDLYVGKDGNIYLKGEGEETPEKEAATLTDSDAFLGLHMYGMDHPLYQEVSKSRTRLIGSEPFDQIDREITKLSRDLSTLKPVLNKAQFTETKGIFHNESPRLKTTAHRRPPTLRPTPQTSSSTISVNPFLTTTGNSTPYISNFAKTLIKIKKAADADIRPIRDDNLRLLRDLKD